MDAAVNAELLSTGKFEVMDAEVCMYVCTYATCTHTCVCVCVCVCARARACHFVFTSASVFEGPGLGFRE